jgi:hypothetical protein
MLPEEVFLSPLRASRSDREGDPRVEGEKKAMPPKSRTDDLRRAVATLLVVALAAPPGLSFTDPVTGPPPWGGGKHAFARDPWKSVDDLAASGDRLWSDFERQFGSGWRVRTHPRALTPDSSTYVR